ncbi:hypothetical protein Trihar35433_2004 [Trichoderma harzianum]|nr:hypothetical protein Trihar35433_2004 [Trichoderma harzianum]
MNSQLSNFAVLLSSMAADMEELIIALSKATIDSLQCFRGDTVLVRGKKRKETMLIVLADEQLNERRAKINRVAKRIAVFPIADTVEGLTGSLFDVFLALYFREAYRPENLSYHGH